MGAACELPVEMDWRYPERTGDTSGRERRRSSENELEEERRRERDLCCLVDRYWETKCTRHPFLMLTIRIVGISGHLVVYFVNS
jgi:hypothetical protein